MIVFFCSAFFASAMTQSEKQALITQITEQIAVLQAQLEKMIAEEKLAGATSNVIKPFSGTVTISTNSDYASQTASWPKSSFKLSAFTLKNNTNEIINLKDAKVNSFFNTDENISSQYLKNIYITCQDKKSATIEYVSYENNFTTDCKIPVSGSVNINVFAEISSSVPVKSIIKTKTLVSGLSEVTNTKVYTNTNEFYSGQQITVDNATFSATYVAVSPLPKIVKANQVVDVVKFKFTSKGDAITLKEFKALIPNYGLSVVIKSASLKDADTGVVLTPNPIYVSSSGNQYFLNFTGLNTSIDFNSSKTLLLSFTLNQVNTYNNSGKNIVPVLIYAKATNSKSEIIDGVAKNYSSGFSADKDGFIIADDGIKGDNIYVFKNFPEFVSTSKSLKSSTDIASDIYDFQIKADASGDIAIKQLTFSVSISDPNTVFPSLKDFKFFKGDVDYTDKITFGEIINNNFTNPASVNGIGVGTHKMILIFNNEETIFANATSNFTLKASLHNFIKSSSISTNIISDTDISNNGNYLRSIFTPNYGLANSSGATTVSYYNLLWSDKSASGFPAHSDSNGYATGDWFNGYGITGLPTLSQTITAK